MTHGLLEPVPRGEVMVLPLRWEATGVTGRLFPVLDADLTRTPAGAGRTLMTLNGAYRPPLGGIGAELDRDVLRRAAAATIESLLTRIVTHGLPGISVPGGQIPRARAGFRGAGLQGQAQRRSADGTSAGHPGHLGCVFAQKRRRPVSVSPRSGRSPRLAGADRPRSSGQIALR
jgi:hypothetical protein